MPKVSTGYDLSWLLSYLCETKSGKRTDKQIAAEIGISPRQFRNWKSGKTKVNKRDFQNIANVFGIPEGHIYDFIMRTHYVANMPLSEWPKEAKDEEMNFLAKLYSKDMTKEEEDEYAKFMHVWHDGKEIVKPIVKPIIEFAKIHDYNITEEQARNVASNMESVLLANIEKEIPKEELKANNDMKEDLWIEWYDLTMKHIYEWNLLRKKAKDLISLAKTREEKDEISLVAEECEGMIFQIKKLSMLQWEDIFDEVEGMEDLFDLIDE